MAKKRHLQEKNKLGHENEKGFLVKKKRTTKAIFALSSYDERKSFQAVEPLLTFFILSATLLSLWDLHSAVFLLSGEVTRENRSRKWI